MPKVQLNENALDECLCPGCPVQEDSECVQDAISDMPEGGVPDPEKLVAVYCSIGTSRCEDLNGLRECLCPRCAVWEGRDLNSRYYCLAGNADAVDIET